MKSKQITKPEAKKKELNRLISIKERATKESIVTKCCINTIRLFTNQDKPLITEKRWHNPSGVTFMNWLKTRSNVKRFSRDELTSRMLRITVKNSDERKDYLFTDSGVLLYEGTRAN